MKCELMNERILHEFHIFLWICASNVFSMHNINAWNVQYMNEWYLHNFHYKVVKC
jgi:hypothetical protein